MQLLMCPNRTLPAFAAIVLGHLLVWVPQANAQSEPNWSTLRAVENPTANDASVVRDWLEARIQEIIAHTDPQTAREAGKAFYDKIKSEHGAVNATRGFQQMFVRGLNEAANNQYKAPADANGGPSPLGRFYLLLAVTDFGSATAIDLYVKALENDPSSAVRERAATGLLKLRAEMNNQQLTDTRNLMQRVGQNEMNAVVLSRIYSFLSETQGNQVTATLPMVQAILEARFKRFELQWVAPTYADAEAAAWLGERFRSSPAAQRTALISLLARLMTDATQVYANRSLPPSATWGVEYVILVTEAHLRTATNTTSASPSITTAMLDGKNGATATQKAAMLAELEKWVGAQTSGTQGLLNRAPYNLPVGLDITRPAPPSEKAVGADSGQP